MSSQAIADYLTKQIFIEKNIITFRALSRHLSIHVNAAKNELATYHHNAPYQSQPCTATFMLTGILKYKERLPTQDVDMDGSASATQEEDEEDDGEWAPRVTVTVVNEKDFEDTKDSYEEIHSISIYSLAPTSLHDASLLCTSIAQIRETDRAKGQAYAATVGRIATKGIKQGASKKKAQPAAPIAGPSTLKAPVDTKPAVKLEAKEPEKGAADKGKEKEKDKPKQTGKLNFFSKPVESKTVIKKEEPAADSKKKLFFGKPVPKKETVAPTVEAKAAPSKPPLKAETPAPVQKKKADEPEEPTVKVEEKIPPVRGLKRKSSVGLESRERTPQKLAGGADSSRATDNTGVKVKRRVVLSDDDESDGAPAKPVVREPRPTTRVVDSDAERDAMALMDIDDDEVERVSRVPSTTVSSRGSIGGDDDDDAEDEGQASKAASPAAQDDGDVDMEDLDAPVKAKPKPRKPKTVIPVGRNGLKKRKVMKTRRTIGEDGYTRKEDYSDWESVDGDAEPEEAPVPVKAAVKAKAKAAAVKKESDTEDTPEKVEKAKAAPAKKAATKAPTTAKSKAAAKAAGSAKGKAQQQKLNFFGPKKT